MRFRYFVPLILALALSVSACGKAGKVVVAAESGAFNTLEGFKLTKDSYCDAGTIPASSCEAIAKAFVPVWQAYLALNAAVLDEMTVEAAEQLVTHLKTTGVQLRDVVLQLQGDARQILLDILARAILTQGAQ